MMTKLNQYEAKDGIIAFDLLMFDDNGDQTGKRKQIAFYDRIGKTLYKVVSPSVHFFVKYNGYAMATVLFEDMAQRPVETVKILERKKGECIRKLEAPFTAWVTHGQTVQYGNYEKQVVLDIRHMNTEGELDGVEPEVVEGKQLKFTNNGRLVVSEGGD